MRIRRQDCCRIYFSAVGSLFGILTLTLTRQRTQQTYADIQGTHTPTHTAYLAYTVLLMRVYAVVLAQVMDGRTIAARLFLLLSLIFSFSPSHSLSLPLSLPVRKLCVKSSNILFYNQLLLLLRK